MNKILQCPTCGILASKIVDPANLVEGDYCPNSGCNQTIFEVHRGSNLEKQFQEGFVAMNKQILDLATLVRKVEMRVIETEKNVSSIKDIIVKEEE